MESSLARLSSGSSRIFLLLLEKLEPEKLAGALDFRLEKLDISEAKKYFF
jgi:hypothetical protein